MRLKIVTAADRSHARPLVNFIKTANYFEPDAKLTVYDLGLGDNWKTQVMAVLSKRRHFEFKDFNFDRYPDYFKLDKFYAGAYAWKPVIIHDEIQQSIGKGEWVAWMDAGTLLHKKQQRLRQIMKTEPSGIFAMQWHHNITVLTHPKVWGHLSLSPAWGQEKKVVAAGYLWFDPENPTAREVVEEWAQLAQIKDCIAPDGAAKKNHRFDQSLLSILLHRRKISAHPPMHDIDRMRSRRTDFVRLMIRYLKRGRKLSGFSIQNKHLKNIRRMDLYLFRLFAICRNFVEIFRFRKNRKK